MNMYDYKAYPVWSLGLMYVGEHKLIGVSDNGIDNYYSKRTHTFNSNSTYLRAVLQQ